MELAPWPVTTTNIYLPFSLNTSAIRPAPLEVKIRAAEQAGYDALELWVNDLKKHEDGGGSLKELGKTIRDKGLFLINVIGLWDCMPEPEDAFKASLKASRDRMRMARHVQKETGSSNLVLAGGVAFNCVANGEVLRAGIFDNLMDSTRRGRRLGGGPYGGPQVFPRIPQLLRQRQRGVKRPFRHIQPHPVLLMIDLP